MQYASTRRQIDIYTDKRVKLIKEFAREIIRETDGFDSARHAVKMVYRGRFMDDEMQLGNYVQGDDLVQVFRVGKPGADVLD